MPQATEKAQNARDQKIATMEADNMNDDARDSSASRGSIACDGEWRTLAAAEFVMDGDEADANFGLREEPDWRRVAWWMIGSNAKDARYRRRRVIQSKAVPIPPRIQESMAKAIREARK
jgi:hypothetical protein